MQDNANPNPLARFVKNKLEVERPEQDQVYVLTEESVSPTRGIERTAVGRVREETICTLAKSAKFVDLAGCICDVPLRTGRVLSHEPQAAWYENYIVTELVRAGQVPLASCPFTTEFSFVGIRGPLLKEIGKYKPADAEGCAGRPDGCEHMQELIRLRRAEHLKQFLADQEQVKFVTAEQATAMMTSMADAFGVALDRALEKRGDIMATRTGLKGDGERDEPAGKKK